MKQDRENSFFLAHKRIAGLLTGFCLWPISIIFSHYGQPERGLVCGGICLAFIAVIYLKRSIIMKKYIIMTLVLSFFAQIMAVIIIHMPKWQFLGIIVFPIAVVDYLAMIFVLQMVARLVGENGNGADPQANR